MSRIPALLRVTLATALAAAGSAVAIASAAAGPPARGGDFVTSDKVRIHYRVLGAGTPVLLIHGYTSSGETWMANGVAAALARRHRVIVIDNRGHGLSDKPHDPARYGLERMSRDSLELMDALHLSRAHVVGYSMGGMITEELLGLAPGRLISATVGGMGLWETDPELAARAAAVDTPGSDPQELQALAALRARPNRDEVALKDVRVGLAIPSGPDPRPTPTVPLDLRTIRVPVLAINGEYDRPYAKTVRMQRELPDFTNLILKGKSHNTAIEAGYMPPRFVSTLTWFIDSHDGR